jgi:nucleoside-diphosphate-sugar epimerase
VGTSYSRSFGLPVSIVRPFNTFGPRQSARAVIPTIIAQALRGGVIKLGSLTPTRDMNYVNNTIDGFLAASGSAAAEGEVVNIGSGREISIGDLARLIVSMTGGASEIVEDSQRIRPVNSEVERLLCDNAKATRLLGWSPKVSLEDGLSHTIEWIGQHLGQYKSHLYNV